MEISYTIFDLLFYLLLYAFLGWCVEVFCAAVKNGRFVNRGFLNLPLNMPCGIAAALLLPVLGTMNHKTILQYIMTLVIYILVRCVTDQFVRGVSRGTFAAAPKGRPFFLNAAAAAAIMLLVYLVVHPGVMGLLYLMPKWLERTLVIAGIVLILADFIGVMRALRTSSATRLNKAGPGDHPAHGRPDQQYHLAASAKSLPRPCGGGRSGAGTVCLCPGHLL